MIFEQLSGKDKRRIALILQGTSDSPGCHISKLEFGSKSEQEQNAKMFVKLMNTTFRGIIQFVLSDSYILALASNSGSKDDTYNSVNGPAIALACLILFHYFEYEKGPTLANLQNDAEGTPLHDSITAHLRTLKVARWIIVENIQNIEYYQPTEVMFACISFDTIKQVYESIYSDSEERPKLIRFFNKNYRSIQQSLGANLSMTPTKQSTFSSIIHKKGESE